jgi:dipeptidyl aminopeptidase/acylaminoacyl peptidase
MLVLASGCWAANHRLIHPESPPYGAISWSADVARGDLLVHLEGVRPEGAGPFPVVLVHPEGGKTAADMRYVTYDLARRGYAAIAADYARRVGGEFERNVFAWRSPADVTAALELIVQRPEVDRDRIGLLGFSQGGVVSLLMAAYAPERVAAVVSYYPVTDFPRWLGSTPANPFQRMALAFVRWFFRSQSGADSDAEFDAMLRGASAYHVADRIRAPVLLIHGENDTTAPVEESERMAARLAQEGVEVELMVIPGAVHIFNFRQPAAARLAWRSTIVWLDRWLR